MRISTSQPLLTPPSWRTIGLVTAGLVGAAASGYLIVQGSPFVAGIGPLLVVLALSARNVAFPFTLVLLTWAIFWLPGVPLSAFELAKDGALILWLVLGFAPLILDSSALRVLFYTRTAKILGVFLLLLLLGVFFDPALDSLAVWIRYSTGLLIYALAMHMFKYRLLAPQTAFMLLLAPVTLSAAYVSLQTILGVNGLFAPPTEYLTFSYVSDAAKLMGFTYRYSAMSWAIAFVLPIPLALALGVWRQSRRLHWGWILLFLLLLASLIFSRGRGGLLAGFLGIGVVVWKLAPGKLRLWTLLLGVGAVAALLWTNSGYLEEYLFKGKFSMNFLLDDGISGSTINSLTSGRTDIWQVAAEHIIENPFIGFGLGNSNQLWRSISATANTHLHNLYLNVAVEAGVIPALFAIGMMVYIIVVYYRRITKVIDTKSQTIPEVAIWMVAGHGILIAYFVSTLVELGSMFASRYMGFPFWVSLAALDILLLQTSPETNQHQNSPKSVSRNPRLGSHPAKQ